MATYTRSNTAIPGGAIWDSVVAGATVLTNTPTLVVLLNTDGTYTEIAGTGLNISAVPPLSTTITQLSRYTAGGSTGGGSLLEQVTSVAASITLAGLVSAPIPTAYVLFGNDSINGGSLVDTLFGQAGNDTMTGGSGNDTFYGGDGFDIFFGNSGDDTMFGGNQGTLTETGPSQLWLGGRADYSAGASAITVSYTNTLWAGGPYTIATVTNASSGTDTLVGVQQVRGTAFGDTYTAQAGYNGLFGEINEFEGLGGNDTITGNGQTRISYNSATVGVIVNLAAGTATFLGGVDGTGTGAVGADTFTGVNAVRGSAQNDQLTGGALHGALAFDPGAGNDTITGSSLTDQNTDSNTVRYTTVSGAGITVTLGLTGAGNENRGTVAGNAGSNAGTDSLINVERVRGTNFADTFTVTNLWSGNYGTFNDIEGMGGNDTVTGNGTTRINYSQAAAAVTIDLQAGTAFSTAGGDAANIGTDTFLGGINSIRGSQYDDTMIGSNGVNAEGFRGDRGNDTMDGGGGTLDIVQFSGDTRINSITIALAESGDTTYSDGLGGTDTIRNIEGISGSEGNDSLTGNGLANVISGQNGNDTINGGGGDDKLSGDDVDLVGNPFGAFAIVDAGNDGINGGAGNDTIHGGGGNDFITGGADDDIMEGGAGFDYTNYLSASSGVTVDLSLSTSQVIGGGQGTDTLTGFEGVYGSGFGDAITGSNVTAETNAIYAFGGNDSISGRAGFDYVEAGDGDDTINPGNDDDFVLGGNGTDTITYADAGAGVFVNLAAIDIFAGTANYSGGGSGFDILLGIENAIGSTSADFLYGSNAANQLTGGNGGDVLFDFAGNDTLSGGAGSDYLVGGAGTDELTGGADQDYFYFFNQTDGKDTITDWRGGGGFDILVIEEPSFNGGLATGLYLDQGANVGRFVNGTAATAATGQFLWNSATSTLSWDADGTGAGAAVEIVTLTGITNLAASDILVL